VATKFGKVLPDIDGSSVWNLLHAPSFGFILKIGRVLITELLLGRYGPDFNFSLFGTLQTVLAGKRFAKNAEIKQAVTSWLQTIDTDFVVAGIQALVPQLDKRLNVNSYYLEV
jgi:hypothetical protein